MKCPKCQIENPETRKFCRKCGAKLLLVCPRCRSENLPSDDFCGECGHKLSLPSEPSPRDLSLDEKLAKIQRYLPKGLTEKILSQRDKIEGERKQVTVMFCDMEGFTPLSESIGPEEAYSIIDQVYEILIHKVRDYEGTVNDMTGDGIVALFGAPIALEDAPERAIRSGYSIHREMARLSDQLKQERAIPPIKMRIGIHTGPVVVGTLGNDLRLEFKAVGDTVNLASRMEGLAEPGATYVTEETFKLTEGLFRFEALGEIEVKGKAEALKTYRVIAPSTRRSRFDVSAERGLTPFVGRERELELLLDGLERSKAGSGQAFSIVSEAGVGKSRFLYELRKAVVSEDVTFLEGRCLSYSRGVAYHPVIDILKANFDIREGDGDFDIKEKVKRGLKILGADEASTLPYLLELLAVKDSGIDKIPMSPEQRKNRIIEALKRIVLKGSEIRPLILAYEDLHWIDKSSEDQLQYLLESIPGSRVLLIFTYRPEFVHTWGAKSYHSQVTLNRLSNRESLMMVSNLLGTGEFDKGLEEFILEKTEGVPFFIEELIKSLKDLKIIEREDNRYRITKDIKEVTIPATIQDVIMARVDSLPEAAKVVLQRAAIVGRESSYDIISRVTGLSERELLSNLSALKDSELLYERGIYPQSTYIFKHALTQEVAYNSLLLKKRKEVHEKVGSAIEELYSERLEEFCEMLAYHYSRSDNFEKAYHYAKLSGEKATANYSNWEAHGFYKEAINALIQMPQTEENKRKQIGVRLLAGKTTIILGFPEGSIQSLEEGERLSEELRDEKSLAYFHLVIGAYYFMKGEPLLALRYQERSFMVAEKIPDIELLASSACSLILSYYAMGEHLKVVDIASRVLPLLEETKRESEILVSRFNAYCTLLAHYGHSMGWLGNFKEGGNLLEKSLKFSLEIDDVCTLCLTYTCYGYFFFVKGEGENTVEHLQSSVRYSEEGQVVLFLGLIWSYLGAGYYLLGELETARNYMERGLKIQIDMGRESLLSLHYVFLSMVHFDSGDFKSAQTCAEKAVGLSQKNHERQWEGVSRIWLGRIMEKADSSQSDKAEENILEGIKLLEQLKLRPFISQGYCFLGELYTHSDQREKALENLNKAKQMFQEMGMNYWLDKTEGALARL